MEETTVTVDGQGSSSSTTDDHHAETTDRQVTHGAQERQVIVKEQESRVIVNEQESRVIVKEQESRVIVKEQESPTIKDDSTTIAAADYSSPHAPQSNAPSKSGENNLAELPLTSTPEHEGKGKCITTKVSMDLEASIPETKPQESQNLLPNNSRAEDAPQDSTVGWTAIGASKRTGLGHIIRNHFGNKGSISNLCSFVIMIIGIILWETSKSNSNNGEPSIASKYILSMGLFGFAGGVTNWLAVKMLFDQIPLVYGSGVIPRRFKEIRQTVKDTIMNTFFDPAYLESYVNDRAKGVIEQLDIPKLMNRVLESPEVDEAITKSLTEAAQTQEGAVLNMAAGFMGGMEGLTRTIKPMLVNFGTEMGPLLSKHMDLKDLVDINSVRLEIDRLMTEKLKLLTPEIVKKLMEQVIRDHLGWLIVWGNVFGGLIGVIAQAAGFGG